MIRHIRNSITVVRLVHHQFSTFTNNVNYGNKNLVIYWKRSIAPKCNKSIIRFLSSESDNSPKDAPPLLSKDLDIQKITEGNPELEHKLQVLLLEAEVLRQEGENIPSASILKERHWKELLSKTSRSARRKYYDFMFKIERKKENEKIKKELKRKEREENPREPEPEGALIYDLKHNNIFLRIYDTTIDNYNNWRAIQAIMFGQKLVIDCGYFNEMTVKENNYCAKQLMFTFAENRSHQDPFDLHFCNMQKNNALEEALLRSIPTLYEPWFPLNVHECSYLDLFPKEQLVYLTPHCREVMTEYDHDAIYIIGGIVDKVSREPYSLAKAKKEGLRMAKLPLDYYLQWGPGSGKSLNVNHVASILLDMKITGDWNYALRHVPRRKLSDDHVVKVSRIKGRLSYDNEPDFIKKEPRIWKPKQIERLNFNRYNNRNENETTESSNHKIVDLQKIMNEVK